MNDEMKLHHDDDGVVRGLRELHSPPGGEGYWAGLEARILTRIAQGEGAWWLELDRWTRPAVLAAAALLLSASLAVFRTRDRATQVAYEDVLAAPIPISIAGAARPASLQGLQGLQGEREEILRFLVSY